MWQYELQNMVDGFADSPEASLMQLGRLGLPLCAAYLRLLAGTRQTLLVERLRLLQPFALGLLLEALRAGACVRDLGIRALLSSADLGTQRALLVANGDERRRKSFSSRHTLPLCGENKKHLYQHQPFHDCV